MNIFLGAYNIQNNNSTSENSFGSNGVTPVVGGVVGGAPVSGIPLLPVLPQSTQPPAQQSSILSPQILGSTPLSQIGCPPLLDQYSSNRKFVYWFSRNYY